MRDYGQFKERLLKDRAIWRAYEDAGPEFEIIKLLIERRLHRGITQKDLARRIGTRQSAISRFEKGRYNPSLHFLQKVARGLDTRVRVTLTR